MQAENIRGQGSVKCAKMQYLCENAQTGIRLSSKKTLRINTVYGLDVWGKPVLLTSNFYCFRWTCAVADGSHPLTFDKSCTAHSILICINCPSVKSRIGLCGNRSVGGGSSPGNHIRKRIIGSMYLRDMRLRV